MAFDIHLHTCNLGRQVRRTENPFTGEPIDVPIDTGLNGVEREAVLELLAEMKAVGPDPDYYYRLNFPDGGSADICAGPLDGQYACVAFGLEIVVMTPEVISFLFRLAQTANMSINPIMNDSVPILTSAPQDEKIRQRWPNAVVVCTAGELASLLANGYREWNRYRDQIVKQNS